MNNTQKLLTELVDVYNSAGMDCANELAKPADIKSIEAVFDKLELPVSDALVSVWTLYGGQTQFGAGVEGLFGAHMLFSPQDALNAHEQNRKYWLSGQPETPVYPPSDGDAGSWVPCLLPFAGWDAYQLCIDVKNGDIWDFEPYKGLWLYIPGMDHLLQYLVNQVKSGVREIDLYDFQRKK